MLKKWTFAIALLAATTTLAHAEDAGKKDPKTGKSCVAFFSSELAENGRLRMNFRNTCDTPFEIRIPVGRNIRKNSIEAGTPEKPAKAYVVCSPNDGCESAKWVYE